MLTCLTVLGKASTALANGDSGKGQDLLSSVVNCSKKNTCHSRKMCAMATMGVIKGAVGVSDQA
jgi:hypothetical protein